MTDSTTTAFVPSDWSVSRKPTTYYAQSCVEIFKSLVVICVILLLEYQPYAFNVHCIVSVVLAVIISGDKEVDYEGEGEGEGEGEEGVQYSVDLATEVQTPLTTCVCLSDINN